MSLDDEVAELRAILDTETLMLPIAQELPTRFSAQARAELIRRVAGEFAPPPSGWLLARLLLIADDPSRPVITQAYLTNLHSPLRLARQASLNGLVELGYPQLDDVGRGALHDVYDPIVASAARILVGPAVTDPQLRALLVGVHAAHKDDPDFHLTTSLLAAHGIEPGEIS
jgi:hypothetical protein